MKKILVLGNDNRAFLTVVRSLGRKGIIVHVGWCDHSLAALHSRYIEKVIDLPPFLPGNDLWLTKLKKVLFEEKYCLVIPCNDESILPLQNYRNQLNGLTPIYLLDNHIFPIVMDKYAMASLARKIGVNQPYELKIDNKTDCRKVISDLSLPVVVKPRSSFRIEKINQKQHVRKIYEEKELVAIVQGLEDGDFFYAQKNFNGSGIGIEVLVLKGKTLFAFQHVRVHEPLTGGGSSYRKSANVIPALHEASSKIMAALNYTGVGMIEFKYDFNTDEWIFIELNARFWGSLPLAVSAGADFPYFLYQMLIEQKKDFENKYKVGLFCRNMRNDFEWLITNLRADKSDPTLATLPNIKVVKEFMNILRMKERNDTFVLDDPLPGFFELLSLVYDFGKRVYCKLSTLANHLKIHRFVKRFFLRSKLENAQSILFICKGNICRSPFAEYYFKKIAPPKFPVSSAGYFPKEGRKSPSEAIEAARKFGVDLEGHRSKILNEDLLNTFDLIIIFDEENRQKLLNRFPFVSRKMFFVSAPNSAMPLIVKDPYSGDANEFFKTYDVIAQHLKAIRTHMHENISEGT